MYRICEGHLEVLLVHPGGPFWRNNDDGARSIPKGEVEDGEGCLDTAQREFQEEIGVEPIGPFTELSPIKQKNGKIVHAWAFEGNCDPATIHSNTFTIEWPPKSGRIQTFPEIDRAGFFDMTQARKKINTAQMKLIEELEFGLSTMR